METKHTTGKWTMNTMPLPSRKVIEIAGDSGTIAEVKQLRSGKIYTADHDPEAKANAKLICAAPELLKALQNMVNISYDTARPTKAEKNHNMDIAIAAIKAATL